MAMYNTPKQIITANGRIAELAEKCRIIRSLYEFMAHVVGKHRASIFIRGGSSSCGPQHPPTAAIVMIAIAPAGKTESPECTTPATIQPNPAAPQTLPP